MINISYEWFSLRFIGGILFSRLSKRLLFESEAAISCYFNPLSNKLTAFRSCVHLIVVSRLYTLLNEKLICRNKFLIKLLNSYSQIEQ